MPEYRPDEILDRIASLRAQMYRIAGGQEEGVDPDRLMLLSRELDALIYRFMCRTESDVPPNCDEGSRE